MMMIPFDFCISPFYHHEQLKIDLNSLTEKQRFTQVPFYYDITSIKKPWESPYPYIEEIYQLWLEEEIAIRFAFKGKRKHEIASKMRISIALYIDALFWLNGQRLNNLHKIEEDILTLTYRPLNAKDRLAFIIKQHNQYHAFIQLQALMEELNKMCARIKVMKNRKNSEGL
ncbi:YpoC family protein [Alkalihalobacillus trypoxylicola]|uniref:YpoC-like domain-containing protein n=1 Tax=Alkalihalobacillus trypoxylicola TaxID=519424 RepID=A0A162EHG0_9BACI|nr:hypothetical protein [Alkalihalobacillus trypoxylicola]KYG32896.1 hypothetical protein AZF04_18230 [Alkalihalobacillus trypoxylicola]